MYKMLVCMYLGALKCTRADCRKLKPSVPPLRIKRGQQMIIYAVKVARVILR